MNPFLVIAMALLLAGCAVGPDYRRPAVTAPSSWKEGQPDGAWKMAVPRDEAAKGEWWTVFGDSVLNGLESEAIASNQDLRAAVARVTEARASARISEADFFPDLSLDPKAQRILSDGHALGSPVYPYPSFLSNDYKVPLDLSYEIDLWGRVRRIFEAATNTAQASVADYQSLVLILEADLAQNYFSLRALDGEHALLTRTVELRQKTLDLVQQRFAEGMAPELDVVQAKTALATVEAQRADIEANRARIEHALAVLTGRPPSALSLPERPIDLRLPVVPTGLPSDLLERRPDVARQERLVAAANARIGVAQAAFFPVVRLTGTLGVESTDIANLFTWGSRGWAVGPSISIPLFEGGALSANLREMRAAYEETVAHYRQQALVAFRDVEDGLSGLRILGVEADAQDRAVAAAHRAAELSRSRYQEGIASYLQVIDTERELLEAQRVATQLEGQRFVTTVLLIKALGGGWGTPPP